VKGQKADPAKLQILVAHLDVTGSELSFQRWSARGRLQPTTAIAVATGKDAVSQILMRSICGSGKRLHQVDSSHLCLEQTWSLDGTYRHAKAKSAYLEKNIKRRLRFQ